MKATALFLTAILILSACATTNTDKIPGQYAVVIERTPTIRTFAFPADEVVAALRERLGNVQLVESADAGAFDAVIVLTPHKAMRSHLASSRDTRRTVEPFKREHGVLADPDRGRAVQFVQVVEFDILRDGRNIGHGAARFDRSFGNEDKMRDSSPASNHTRLNYAAGIEVARAVVKALRTDG